MSRRQVSLPAQLWRLAVVFFTVRMLSRRYRRV